MPEYYGDLNDPGGMVACNELTDFPLKPITIAFWGQRKPILWSEYDDKMLILAGSAKTTHYRFLPVIKTDE